MVYPLVFICMSRVYEYHTKSTTTNQFYTHISGSIETHIKNRFLQELMASKYQITHFINTTKFNNIQSVENQNPYKVVAHWGMIRTNEGKQTRAYFTPKLNFSD